MCSSDLKTKDIQETLIKSAADLIDEEHPNYQYVAGRLINYHLRKEVYGDITPWPLLKLIQRNVDIGYYDKEILDLYTEKELAELDAAIDHDRDMKFTYAAMEQWRGKYLVKNRVNGEMYETPQTAYMMIAATLFARYPKETRLKWVKIGRAHV